MENAVIEFKKELKTIHKEISAVGYKSEAGKLATKKESDLKLNFMNLYGKDALLEVLTGKVSSFAKLQNSKGNGYGNI